MSYVRWSGSSDLYIYADCRGGITCCGCLFGEERDGSALGPLLGIPVENLRSNVHHTSLNFATAREMADHVQRHIDAGHTVPDGLIEDILDDAEFIEADQ